MTIDTSVRDQLDRQEAALNNLCEALKQRDAELAAAKNALTQAGIALRFYAEWMRTHDGEVRYPFGIETEQMIAALAGAK